MSTTKSQLFNIYGHGFNVPIRVSRGSPISSFSTTCRREKRPIKSRVRDFWILPTLLPIKWTSHATNPTSRTATPLSYEFHVIFSREISSPLDGTRTCGIDLCHGNRSYPFVKLLAEKKIYGFKVAAQKVVCEKYYRVELRLGRARSTIPLWILRLFIPIDNKQIILFDLCLWFLFGRLAPSQFNNTFTVFLQS